MKKGKPFILALISAIVGGVIFSQVFLFWFPNWSKEKIYTFVFLFMAIDFLWVWYTLSKNENFNQDKNHKNK